MQQKRKWSLAERAPVGAKQQEVPKITTVPLQTITEPEHHPHIVILKMRQKPKDEVAGSLVMCLRRRQSISRPAAAAGKTFPPYQRKLPPPVWWSLPQTIKKDSALLLLSNQTAFVL